MPQPELTLSIRVAAAAHGDSPALRPDGAMPDPRDAPTLAAWRAALLAAACEAAEAAERGEPLAAPPRAPRPWRPRVAGGVCSADDGAGLELSLIHI